jgi:hypothetical protein
VISSSYTKDAKHLVDVLKYIKYHFNIEHVRCDYDRVFVAKLTCKYLNDNKLADIDLSPFKRYKEEDFLLVHMLYREINYKRRRTFNELAIFRGYRGGNVLVELCVPSVKLKNDKIKNPLYVLPMWRTKYVGSSIEDLPDVVKNYYNYYLK